MDNHEAHNNHAKQEVASTDPRHYTLLRATERKHHFLSQDLTYMPMTLQIGERDVADLTLPAAWSLALLAWSPSSEACNSKMETSEAHQWKM
jgi:hypothetical protein